jgi:hypothetical protein
MNRQLSVNFNILEFKGIEPEPLLLTFLESLRLKVASITITDSARTIIEHIALYKKIYKDNWLKKIKWKSRHLPKFNSKLRAVDIVVLKENGKLMSGDEILKFAKEWSKNNNCPIGCGAGKKFAHIDVDRKQFTEWAYSY